MNTGIEMSLRQIAALAWRDRLTPSVHMAARRLTDEQPVVSAKVKAIVAHIVDWNGKVSGRGFDPRLFFPFKIAGETLTTEPPFDADDAVLVAATMCLSVGIQCRIVGARYRQSWTCWLAYQAEGGLWATVDVFKGVPINDLRKVPDEQITVECRGGDV